MRASLLLALLLCSGCRNDDIAKLPVTGIETWPLPAFEGRMPGPRSVNVFPDDRVVSLDNAGRVLVFQPDGTLASSWTMPAFDVGKPEGVKVLLDGRIAVADTHYHRVVIFTSEGKVDRMFGSEGTAPGLFIYPVGITQDPQGFLYVAEYGANDRVQKFTPDGAHVLTIGSFGTGPAALQRPSGLVWHEGLLYVADAINNRIQIYNATTGAHTGSLDRLGLDLPYDIAVDRDGTLLIVEYGAGRVTRATRDGKVLGRFGSTGQGHGQLSTPWGMTVDSKGRIRIADTGNRRIVGLVP